MSTTDQEQKRTSRRLRRQRKGDTSGDSGSESDTIFEEASDYESAEEAESVEGTPKQHQEDDRQPGEQRESDYEEADEEEDGTAPALDDSPEQVNDENGGGLRILNDSLQARDKEDEIDQHEGNEDEDGQVEGDENHQPLSEHDEEEEEEEEEDEDTLEEKRESGDGQEEPAEEEVELDDDEDLKNPAYIPRKGAYYQHDVRNDDQKGDKRHRRERRLWKEDDNKWLHDKYDEAEQGPKSHYELINYHGYDVRDPTQQDRGDNYRRGRGRGSRGGRGRGGRAGDVTARGRGRGRGKRLQLSTYDDEAGGDRREEESKSTGYRNSKTSKSRSRLEQDFPELPSKGEGDRRQTSESTVSYAERARGHQVEPEDDGMRIKYQKDKTYYEKDSGESYRNVTSDYRYRPAATKSVNYQHRQNQQHRHPHHMESGSRERSDIREKETNRDYSFSDSKQFYQLEFVNKNYQKDSEDNVKSSKPQGDHENEKTFDRTLEQEPPAPSRKVYSSERHQTRTRTPPPDSVPESSSQFTDERTRDYSRPPLNIHNLKIQVKGSERLVHYQESKDRRDDDDNVRYLENNNDEDGEEEQRMDKRERSRPKRYSSQRQRVQDPPTSHYYAEDLQSTSQSSARKPDSGGSQVAASERLSSHRGPGETSIGRQVPSSHSGQGLQSSLPPNNMMQQGMMMMSPDGQIPTHGVRPPQLPSPAFFQQHQGNMPPAYFVGPMVNYGAPQYPMGAPLQFQHFSMGMPPSPQSGVAAAPPPPPPAPQSAAGSSSPSSSHNPSVQQVGGVTYYSPMQQPLQIRHPPPKRQSKPLTIESPPEVKLH